MSSPVFDVSNHTAWNQTTLVPHCRWPPFPTAGLIRVAGVQTWPARPWCAARSTSAGSLWYHSSLDMFGLKTGGTLNKIGKRLVNGLIPKRLETFPAEALLAHLQGTAEMTNKIEHDRKCLKHTNQIRTRTFGMRSLGLKLRVARQNSWKSRHVALWLYVLWQLRFNFRTFRHAIFQTWPKECPTGSWLIWVVGQVQGNILPKQSLDRKLLCIFLVPSRSNTLIIT